MMDFCVSVSVGLSQLSVLCDGFLCVPVNAGL